MSLANIYFKLQHDDTRHEMLVNKEQEKVVDMVIEKLRQVGKDAPHSGHSHTHIPFYDTILPLEKRNLLA